MEGGGRGEGAEGATAAEAEAPTDPLEEKRRELKRRRGRLGEGAEGAEAELLTVEEAMLELQVQQRDVSALPRSDEHTVTKQEFRKRFTEQMKVRGEAEHVPAWCTQHLRSGMSPSACKGTRRLSAQTDQHFHGMWILTSQCTVQLSIVMDVRRLECVVATK